MNAEQLNQLIKQVAQDAARYAIAEYKAQHEHPRFDRERAESMSPGVSEAYSNFFGENPPVIWASTSRTRVSPLQIDAIRERALTMSPEMAEAFCNLHGQHSPRPTVGSTPAPQLRTYMQQMLLSQGTIKEDSEGSSFDIKPGALRRSPASPNLLQLGK
jgi:hypothetical protein